MNGTRSRHIFAMCAEHWRADYHKSLRGDSSSASVLLTVAMRCCPDPTFGASMSQPNGAESSSFVKEKIMLSFVRVTISCSYMRSREQIECHLHISYNNGFFEFETSGLNQIFLSVGQWSVGKSWQFNFLWGGNDPSWSVPTVQSGHSLKVDW